MIKQSQRLKIKSQILSNLFNEKYWLRLGEFKNTTGTERVKLVHMAPELQESCYREDTVKKSHCDDASDDRPASVYESQNCPGVPDRRIKANAH